jgi:XTP/dITP diphosphohydrolase
LTISPLVKTFVATKNTGKLAELRSILARSALELDTYPLYADVAETASDYLSNARLKAETLFEQLKGAGVSAAVLADDSGLEVEPLDARPGVLSARYGGTDASWPERRSKLLGELENTPDGSRHARFVCAMVLRRADGSELESFGVLVGSIAREERGRFGFGYDPIFIPEGESRTLAQYPEDEKNEISHRRRAADGLLRSLAARNA